MTLPKNITDAIDTLLQSALKTLTSAYAMPADEYLRICTGPDRAALEAAIAAAIQPVERGEFERQASAWLDFAHTTMPAFDSPEFRGAYLRLLWSAAELFLLKVKPVEPPTDVRPIILHLEDGKVARGVRIGPSVVPGDSSLVVDLTFGDGPSVVDRPEWWGGGYVEAYGGLVPESASEGTMPGQWEYAVVKCHEELRRTEPPTDAEVEEWEQEARKVDLSVCTDCPGELYELRGEHLAKGIALMRRARATGSLERLRERVQKRMECTDHLGRLVWDEPTRSACKDVLDWIDEERGAGR